MLVETAVFRLAPGVDEADFLAADRRVQTERIPNQPGFLRRTTARGDDGTWLVITLWDSAESADAFSHDDFAGLVVDETTARYTTLD